MGLRNKTQSLQLPGVLHVGRDEINTGSLNAGVPKDIRQLRYIPAGTIKGPGEQMPQVVGEDFRGCYVGFFT